MSRRRRKTILVLCLLLFISIITADRLYLSSTPEKSPENKKATTRHDIRTYHEKTFTVINVVDGDTIDINHPDPPENYTRIRLWGLDTPETKSPSHPVMYFGHQATDFTTKKTLNKKVTIYLDKNRRTRGYYGRLLAYVKLPW